MSAIQATLCRRFYKNAGGRRGGTQLRYFLRMADGLKAGGGVQLLDGNAEGWKLFNLGVAPSNIALYAGYFDFTDARTRKLQRLDVGHTLNAVYSAIGMAFVMGHRPEAERQARMAIEAYKQDYYELEYTIHTFPIYHLLLRVWADWLDVDPPEWGRGARQAPVLNELFANWQEPDPKMLEPYLLNACDFHTHRCRVTKKGSLDWYEFETNQYHRFPVEILVIFRIRRWMGLCNPVLDHPLMNSLLGTLPPEMEPEMDDLTRAVHARMRSQGFDEDAIYRMMFPG